MANVLVIDDTPMIVNLMKKILQRQQHEVAVATTMAEGLQKADNALFDVIFLDVYLPDGNGLDSIPHLSQTESHPEIIIFSGQGSHDAAEVAIKNGAWDYLQKPISIDDVNLAMRRVLLYRENMQLAAPPRPLRRHGIVGNSPQIKQCRTDLAQAAQSDANALITGETGTGKELFARAIHENSKRSHKNFVVVDCAALPANLIDSTLFGHERGAFTGADRAKVGLVKQADGGTLFLDEIGELPLAFQKTFLRVLQEHRFRTIGSDHETSSDFRLLAATNRNLDQMVKEGLFRQDLLFRIRSVAIELPPLRDRHGDIEDLSLFYCEKICQKYGLECKSFAPDALEALLLYPWPGNVRELVNVIDATINAAYYEPVLFAMHLPQHLRITIKKAAMTKGQQQDTAEPQPAPPITLPTGPDGLPTYQQFREELLSVAEKKYFQDLLLHTQGSLKEACQISGLGRTRLYTILKKHGLSRNSQ